MKQFIFCAMAALLFSCSKDDDEQERTLVGLNFTEANTPDSVTLQNGIVSDVKLQGEDLCYQFTGFDIVQSATRQVDIRGIASYPIDNVACTQALYKVDTTVRVVPLTTGQYILRFFNGQTLFDADTVQVK